MSQFIPPSLPTPNVGVPPELAAYYPSQVGLPNLQPPPINNAPTELRPERLNLRLTFLIVAWLLVPLAIIMMVVVNIIVGGQEKIPLGQMARSNSWELTAEAPLPPAKSIQWTNFGTKADATGNWLIVPLTVKNTAGTPQEISTASFELSDGAGKVYPFSDRLESYAYVTFKGGQNLNVPVAANTAIHTFLLYDVPLNTHQFKLKFKQGSQPILDLGG